MSLRLVQQSQDKKSLLTHVHCRHREKEEEEEEHKIKVGLLLKKTMVTYYCRQEESTHSRSL